MKHVFGDQGIAFERAALVEDADRCAIGDVPRFGYDTERLKTLGWRPALSSDAAVLRAIREIPLLR